jgi:hypothetical protein
MAEKHFTQLYTLCVPDKTNIIYLFPFLLPLEHGASMKLRVSLQFLNLGQSGRAIAQAVSRRLPTTPAWVQTRVSSCGIL